MTITLSDIEQAAQRIESATINTRFEKSQTLSKIAGAELFLKFESLQFTSSFKDRGALNKLLQLSEVDKKSGVIAMSAGNHAKAVAYHAQRLGIPATIVMPTSAPNVKVEDTQNFQARVILKGNTLEEAAQHAHEISEAENLVFVHPFNDEQIMAGQGTVALEMLAAEPALDCIVVPIGGGGLISGVATAAKSIKPDIKIIGVQVAGYPGTYDAIYGDSGYLGGSTIAEGIAVKKPGDLTLEVIDRLVDDVIVVSEEAIEEAISLLVSIEKSVTEGAGASGLAAVLSRPEMFSKQKVGLILSGANIDTRILASVLMRRLVKKGRIVRYKIRIDDSPGTLSNVSATVGESGGNILEVFHQRMFSSLPIKEADLYLTVETKDALQSEVILQKLRELDYQASFRDD
ncbi:MAG: threonine ammonia-lyase [SAR86 cluster bacterium]|uniref:L-serine dehydratase n=1 Tax=SAR86 cluster bacterium TaxID=2030880 RepID=A0A2A5C6U1_9GAMM|nr:MAG: threonine ammonia-lyase [SAR86 cluster bacterium]